MRGPAEYLKYARIEELYASRPHLKRPARHPCPACGGMTAFAFPEGGSGCLACGHGFDMGRDDHVAMALPPSPPPVRRATPPDVPGYADRDYWWLKD